MSTARSTAHPCASPPRACRLDASPAWHAWICAATTLDVLQGIGIEAIHAHDVVLADELRKALDLPPTGSAIVSIVGAEPGLEQSLAAAGIKGATVGGRLPPVVPRLQRPGGRGRRPRLCSWAGSRPWGAELGAP